MKNLILVALLAALSATLLLSCTKKKPNPDPAATNAVKKDTKQITEQDSASPGDSSSNPFFSEWDTPFGIPPYEEIKDEHYLPAFERAIKKRREEIAAINNNEESPTFENTIVALEEAGSDLTSLVRVFSGIAGTDTNDTIKSLQAEVYPRLTRENDAILLDEVLFKRVSHVHNNRDPLKLDSQDSRLLALTYLDFIRSGSALGDEAKKNLKEINAEISKLTTQFSQNLLADTKAFELIIEDETQLVGLDKGMINAAKSKAISKGKTDAWLFGLDRATYEGFMTLSEKRDLRKKMFDAYRARGANGNDNDNRDLVLQISQLRAQRAALLGYESHAHYQLETRMAKTPVTALSFLTRVWKPGLARMAEEKREMQEIIASEGEEFTLEGHDWWHYAEKLRAKKYAIDESQVKPYFELNNVLSGAFYVAGKLFDLSFKELKNTPKWHPKVRVFEVKGQGNTHLGVFLIDFYSRDSKRGGAWMSSIRQASAVSGTIVRPLITNNLNISPPGEGDPVLLSFGQVNTLFHEFGHGLHGLMTSARYERYAGTSGSPRDFTEFPAQFMEHYAAAREVLPIYAKHYQTGEIIPTELLDKLQAAKTHNQGFKTTEFIAASLLDMAWHTADSETLSKIKDAEAFENKILSEYNLPQEIGPRYKSPYFAHIFSSPIGYSAGYYSYLWSEILDADGFTAFREAGDIFDPTLAKRLSENVYQAGGSAPADQLYRGFRKKDPTIEPLLKIRGLN